MPQYPSMDQAEFDSCYGVKDIDRTAATKLRQSLPKKEDFTCQNAGSWLLSWFPLIGFLRDYELPGDLFSDVTAGFTVGIMNIPQGMAYGLLAGLAPVNGLYVSLVLPFVYAFLTKSHHIAMGTFAVISLMVNKVVQEVSHELAMSSSNSTFTVSLDSFWCGSFADADPDENPVDPMTLTHIAMALSLLVGIIQIFLGCIRFGFLASYLSDSVVQGLTTGAAVHVFTSQVSHVTGIHGLPITSQPLGLIKYYGCLFSKLSKMNWATVLTSIVCITVIYVVKTYIDPKTRPKIKMPLPIDLVVVIFSTLISWYFSLNSHYELGIVGPIPKGLPQPMLPNPKYFKLMLPDAIIIAFVIYTLNVSLAKLMGKKFGYQVDINQEWFSTGICHVVGSIFQCHPGGASLSRSMVQSTAGGKTQMVSIFSSVLVLIVLVAIADIFEQLPKCALAAIIIVALKGMFMQFKALPGLWQTSPIDFMLWLVSFVSVIVLDVTYGLVISIIFACLTLIYRLQWPSYVRLGQIQGRWLFKNVEAYSQAVELSNIKIFRFDAPLVFVNIDKFTQYVTECVGVDPIEEKRLRKMRARKLRVKVKEDASLPVNTVVTVDGHINRVEYVIIDCSSMSTIDEMGVKALKDCYVDYKKCKINVLFAECKVVVREKLAVCKFFDVVPKIHMFPSIEDAVKFASNHHHSPTNSTRSLSSTESESESLEWRF